MSVCASSQNSPVTVWTRVGATFGTPVPLGDVPEGAEGNPIVGFVGGGYLDFELSQRWSLLTEIQFVFYGGTFSTPFEQAPYKNRIAFFDADGRKSLREENTTFTGTATGTFANDYIQFPVLAAWRPLDRFRVVGGGYVGILVDTKSYASGVGSIGSGNEEVEKDMYFDAAISDIDYGAVAGVQYDPFKDISVDLRATIGLTSIFNEDFKTVDRVVQNVYFHMTFAVRVF